MRLDQYMVQLGLAESRQKAQRLIRAGVVLCNGQIMQKPSQTITDSDQVMVVNDVLPYVGRGGLKLERALQLFGVDPTGLVCADIGASTGGFTDCLLQHGAARVYAVDSGREQLHPKLRADTRVVCMEQCNARYLDVSQLGERVPLVVCDVSFLSSTKLFDTFARILSDDGALILLIKPQFEVGPNYIGKNGIVKDKKAKQSAVCHVINAANAVGLHLSGLAYSPIRGGDGNEEYLSFFTKKVLLGDPAWQLKRFEIKPQEFGIDKY